ncbi:MAG: hypothetical protein R3351_06960, partial [Nitrospirales bacterium]|nr:hypothetical protein [Nitrospirales bacterium]
MSPNKKTKSSHRIEHDYSAALAQLARMSGIQPIYRNEAGQLQKVPVDSLEEILELMGISHSKLVRFHKRPTDLIREKNAGAWTEIVPETMVIPRSCLSKGWTLSLPIRRSAMQQLSIRWMIKPDKGLSAKGQFSKSTLQFLQARQIGGAPYSQFRVPFPPKLALGYYTFQIEARFSS